MADLKISQLNSIVTVVPATDVLPVVQGGTTLKITPNQILGAGGTATLASATITGDLTVDTSTLKVDSTNNRVGIGTASPANQLSVRNEGASGISIIDIRGGTGGAGALQISGNGTTLGTTSFNFIQNGAGAFINNQDATPLAVFVNGSERYAISSSGVATWSNVGGVAGTAMTLNSTGLGIGATPIGKFDVYNTGSDTTVFIRSDTTRLGQIVFRDNADAGNQGKLKYDHSTDTLSLSTAATEQVFIDASGNLLVGKAVSSFSTVGVEASQAGFFGLTNSASTNASTNISLYSTGAAAFRFYVGLAGTVFATNTTISAISDARLKENVQDLDVGLGAILALKPRKFDWKEGKGKNIKGDRGFIAQEFETVFPNLIDEWKDPAPEGEAPYKSVRQDLIPVLVKAIQELTARVQTLEAK